MLKIKFADDSEIEVLDDTTIFPSENSSIRSKMIIHAPENSMDISEFEKIFSNKEKTKEIHLINIVDGELKSDVVYTNYSILASIGKQRIDKVNYVDGSISSEMHLVAQLEQLTYIEQQLDALGIKI